VRVPLALLLLAAITRCGLAASAANVGNQVEHISLDADECYRVLDLNFAKEDLKIYLAAGYLIFAKPIGGARLGAIFVTSAEAGDADLLLMPPTRSERSSLAKFTNTPTLEEHFKAAAFIFTDGTGDQLLAQLRNPASAAKKSPDMGGLIVERWSSVLANLVASFETRVVYDILSGRRDTGLFYMAVSGDKLDAFDVLYDPTAQDQILVGKLADRDNRTYFDTWTSFQARSFRSAAAAGNAAPPRAARNVLDNIRIEATIAPDLMMQAVTRGTLKFQDDEQRPRSVVPFSLSPNMQIGAASIDGHPVEVFDRESMRSDLISNREDRQFLLISELPLDASVPHEIEIQHAGAVIRNAGNDVYYVGSRGTWYPRSSGDLARYELTFRYPKALTVVATGKLLEDRIDGDWRITRLKTDTPVRFAGFNLGNFQSAVVERNGYTINLYANRRLESALAPSIPPTADPPNQFPRPRQRNPADAFAPPASPSDPAPRMESLTRDVIDTLDFMTEEFGPTPIRNLAITPIPGAFGQGFPGLVYLSTLAYLDPEQFPPRIRERSEATFFSDLLEAHEVAHQWWGNMVVPASYHDDWLIESLANYSALLLLERKKGGKALDAVLDEYRNHLLSKTPSGSSLESAGPVVWGYRLESSLAPDAWRTVTYQKGTWIIHMLRRRLGDEKFLSLLRDVCSHYRSIGTDQFRELASHYAPASADPGLKIFFDNWVYGTGIPTVKLSYSWRAMKSSGTLSGTLVQRDVDDAFAAFVPVEVQTGNKSIVYWLAAGADPAAFSIPLKAPPTKVTLLAADCLMTTSK
jgi:hypothetical protein